MKTSFFTVLFIFNSFLIFAQTSLSVADSSAIDSLMNHFSTKVSKPQNPDNHIVSYGETMYSIAKKYNLSANDLLIWNKLDKTTKLDKGQLLVLNPPPTTMLLKKENAAISMPVDKIHTVSYGEYPYLIAKKYNISPNQLMAWNKMDENSKLDYGDKLWLINPNAEVFAQGELAEKASLISPIPANAQHEVNAGDTIYSIAQKYGLSPNNLLKWNKLSLHANLEEGQKLWLKTTEGN